MDNNLNNLVRALQAGDVDAFDQIYELTYKTVYYSALGILKDQSLAEDITQDTYIKFMKSPQSYHEKNFLAYLITIAKHLAINEYNARKRMQFTDDIEQSHEISFAGCIEIDAEKKEFIERALSVLDPFEKNVVLLYTLSNMTHHEISLVLSKPIGTITWTYAKALKKIRAAIKEE
ncbi:MAG: sigma-70 family RNA polymerase sigma factor [Candidatus Izemoplasmatales bacterium]|jgi:RNA polymerase sigma-70 factor (ECF subfamily)|nr:sigma-70 family RNA polymerase sigma factor [Candidatus Izemoplasmatales bacterium]MDD3864799.1 sigma-70 family RNA polymerase sigma factor [Candidatus Izemoplasmatales bacterium]